MEKMTAAALRRVSGGVFQVEEGLTSPNFWISYVDFNGHREDFLGLKIYAVGSPVEILGQSFNNVQGKLAYFFVRTDFGTAGGMNFLASVLNASPLSGLSSLVAPIADAWNAFTGSLPLVC